MYSAASNHVQEQVFFSGYASVFNVIDDQNDIILPHAFKKSLLRSHNHFQLLWEHDRKKIIGLAKAKEDKRGLYVQAVILLDMPYAVKAYENLHNLSVNHMSIGYQVVDYYHKNNIRYIKQTVLHEISIVAKPANIAAKIYNLKKSMI